jgi:hypothetical protein
MAPVLSTERPITDTGVITGTGRIGATDITAVIMVAGTTEEAIMVDATIEGVTMAAVPTTTIGTIDCVPIGREIRDLKTIEGFTELFRQSKRGCTTDCSDGRNRLPNFVSNAAASR